MDKLFSQDDVDLTGSLESSADDKDDNIIESKIKDGRDGRKLTIWQSSFTTLTITSTSYFAGTTVTASVFCTAAGLTAGCFG